MTQAATDLVTHEEAQAKVVRDPYLETCCILVSMLDFTMLRRKLVEEDGWTLERCDETEDVYRKFLALTIRYPDRKICPNGPIDDFWHAHILDTRQYATDCMNLNALGGFIHHYPYFGMRGPSDKADLELAFNETVDLFIRHFGIDITAGDGGYGRSCRPQRCP